MEENQISPTTILSLAGAVVAVLGFFKIVVSPDVVQHSLELVVALYFAVSNAVIYFRKLKTGEVKWFGARIQKQV